jgi:nucleotide-binding universal stress UspA family protein
MYTSILVPLDGSPRAETILPHVVAMADRYQATIHLFRVVEPPSMVPDANAMHPVQDPQEAQRLHNRAQEYLSGLAAELRHKDLEVHLRLGHGPVVEAILQAAETEAIDLIAIASHGRSGLSRVFYGSVAAGLLQRIDRPLLLIRSV